MITLIVLLFVFNIFVSAAIAYHHHVLHLINRNIKLLLSFSASISPIILASQEINQIIKQRLEEETIREQDRYDEEQIFFGEDEDNDDREPTIN